MTLDTRGTMADRWIFVGFFLVGVIMLWFLRFEFERVVTAALVLVGLIILYAWLMHRRGRFRLRRNDQSADNLYYLGFIYTVCAMAVSLIRFATIEGVTTLNIVGDLGVGLSTTVVGLVLRIWALHRDDPTEIEDHVRTELVDVAEGTVALIRETAAVVEGGQVLTQQTVTKLNETLRSTADEMAASARAVQQRIEEIEIPANLVVSRLDPVLEELAGSVELFTEKVQAVEVPPDVASSSFERATVTVGESMDRHLDVLFEDAATRVADAIAGIETHVANEIEGLESPMKRIVGRTEAHATELNNATSNVISALDKMGEAMSEARRAWSEIPPSLGGQLERTFDETRGHLSDLSLALLEVRTNGIEPTSRRIGEVSSEVLKVLTRMNQLLEESMSPRSGAPQGLLARFGRRARNRFGADRG